MGNPEDDKAILEELNLVNPDTAQEHYYDWPPEVQRNILGSLLGDVHFLSQGATLIKPVYFREHAHRFICQSILGYYETYKTQPHKSIIEIEINEKLKDNPSLKFYLSELDAVCIAYEPGLYDREFFLDKLTEFAKVQALRVGINRSLDILRKEKTVGRWSKIYEIMEKVFLIQRDTEPGLDYFETIEERYIRMVQSKDNEERFISGFEAIDTRLHAEGLARGEIGAYCGMSGAGKSLALVKSAKCNLQRGKNVCYISLEMEEDKIAERFDTMLTNIPMRSLYFEKEKVFEYLNEGRDTCGKLVIKQFPAGGADVNVIRAYLSHLSLIGFKPDMLVVDYVGEMMDAPGIQVYESRQRIVRDLRGLAVEANICVFTAMQANRSAREAIDTQGFFDDNSLADSVGQVRPLDAFWTISQTKPEEKAGVGKMYISKHRSGEGRHLFYFERERHTLEMKEITNTKYALIMSAASGKAADDLAVEDMAFDADDWRQNRGSGAKKIKERNYEN